MTPDPYEAALAAEILAEASRKRLSHKHIQNEAGIKPRTWGNYFIQGRNHIPMDVVFRVSKVLGVSASELIARAEAASALDDLGALADDSARIVGDPEVDAMREQMRNKKTN